MRCNRDYIRKSEVDDKKHLEECDLGNAKEDGENVI